MAMVVEKLDKDKASGRRARDVDVGEYIRKDSWVWFTRQGLEPRGSSGERAAGVRCQSCGRVMLQASAQRHAVAIHHAAEARMA